MNNLTKNDLTGLVICGGQSRRMGADKSTLVYHQKEQRFHVAEMLMPFCSEVFLSCNQPQTETLPIDWRRIADSPLHGRIGPIAALLTAFDELPGRNFLVLGVDYPFFTAHDLEQFVQATDRKSLAAAFYNTEGFYEPLLAFYSRDCEKPLRDMVAKGEYSLQHFLRLVNAQKQAPAHPQVLFSADNQEDYLWAQSVLKTGNDRDF